MKEKRTQLKNSISTIKNKRENFQKIILFSDQRKRDKKKNEN